MDTQIKTDKISTKAEFSQCYEVRVHVFVKEQNVPLEMELDEKDDICDHFASIVDGKVVGTCRLVKVTEEECSLGRLAVLKEYRKHGIGSLLIKALDKEAIKQGYMINTIHAQTAALSFYLKNGYERVDDHVFDECGIEHCHMIKRYA